MNADFLGEDENDIGVKVEDNNSASHHIEMHKSNGEIYAHQCDAYADHPRNRTPDENEYNEQARRYARYYVYRERGYDTVTHVENPEYIDTVRRAIADLSDAAFEEYFGALYRQLRSHDDSSVDRLVQLPSGVQQEDAVVYELDVYLGVDVQDDTLADQIEEIAQTHGLTLGRETPRSPASVSASELDEWRTVGDQLVAVADDQVLHDALEISAVSGIHVGYPDASGEHQVQRADDPLRREPDTTIELLPYAPDSLSEFREYLDHHLRCQVRDCYAGMGLLAPEPFRVRGFGKFIYARRYDHYNIYPPMHEADPDHNRALL
ncbi:hypothetical protein [Haloferax larsenii]|uniref:Uncharacterized protein n=1 Tax=Haloferax larsenii TaxID=302484 RepID=A0A1H7MRX0_HALLR|nr:hypothetical protein [Haloferax larsenii]SEL14096.1 hypothetical protein SAMN04488691_10374 [Haloferax larsenii]